MAPRTQLDPVPQPIAGLMTLKCECGWEMVTIQPEEHIYAMTMVFNHLKFAHHIELPQICCFWH